MLGAIRMAVCCSGCLVLS